MILSLLLACNSEIALRIPKETIQQTVEEEFPIAAGALGVATLELTDPVVRLPGAGRVSLDVNAEISWREVPVGDAVEELKEVPTAETPAQAVGQTLNILARVAARTRLAPIHTASGSGGIEGLLRYDDGAFYLNETTLTRLELEEVAPEKTEVARDLIQPPLASALDQVPVYVLSEDLKQKAARYVIRDITADESGLKVTLGIPE